MNKFLYCFILILLLNQCLSDDPSEETACDATDSGVACSERTVSSVAKKCTQTSASPLTCAEESKSCDEVTSGATQTICQGLEDSINKCEYIAANTENEANAEAHCKPVAKACTDSLGDVKSDQETICSQRYKSDGAICYFDGNSACKESKKCEDLVLSSEKTISQTACDAYNTDTSAKEKCSANGNKCVLKTYCAEGKPSEHDCSYYEVKADGNICVLQEDSTTKCEEISESEYEGRLKEEADEICEGKDGDACTIIFEKTFFVECELKGQTCQTKEVYATCNSDDEIPNATNEQCSKLVHSSNGYCIKGLKGCIDVDSCENITGTGLTDAICKNFPAPSNYECVKGEGNKCNLVEKKSGGNSSSQALALSLTMLILILVI